jgi:hypothetical protein
MFDRKALSASLHALHNSDLEAGKDGVILRDAIGKIISAIEASTSGLSEADSRHLAEAIDALTEDQEFLARSSILLILEGAPSKDSHKPALTLAQLREKLNAAAP